MRYALYNHLGGIENTPTQLRDEVVSAVADTDIKVTRGAAASIRQALIFGLVQQGWSGEFAIAIGSDISITSVKSQVGLCLQTGNYARVYADLLKLQTLYHHKVITSAIFVVPTRHAAVQLGSNLANSARLQRELDIFSEVINLPLILVSFE